MNTKCAFIALIGSPNAGKSTLLNQLVGSKVAIVTPKVQTTRNLINGICIYETSQLVFIDTPGIFKPKQKLEKNMVKTAWSGIRDADMVALLIDSKRGIDPNTHLIIEALIEKKLQVTLILNKIDLVKPPILLGLAQKLSEYGIFNQVFMINSLTGEGTIDVKKYFAKQANTGPWLYPADEITTAPKRFIVTEVVREKLYLRLNEELPYNLAVETEKWEEMPDGSAKVSLVIYTAVAGHKKIIIGKNGALIKHIGQSARLELEQIFGHRLHIFLFVKVQENWQDHHQL